MGRLAEHVEELEDSLEAHIEENKSLHLKCDEQEQVIDSMTEEIESLKRYIEYIESVYPEMEDAYAVAERLEK